MEDREPSKHTMSQKRRYNVAATSRRCSDVVTTLLRRCAFAGNGHELIISKNCEVGSAKILLSLTEVYRLPSESTICHKCPTDVHKTADKDAVTDNPTDKSQYDEHKTITRPKRETAIKVLQRLRQLN